MEEATGIGFYNTLSWFNPKFLITCLIKCGCDSLIFPSFLSMFTPRKSSMFPSSDNSKIAFFKYLSTCSIYSGSGPPKNRIISIENIYCFFFCRRHIHPLGISQIPIIRGASESDNYTILYLLVSDHRRSYETLKHSLLSLLLIIQNLPELSSRYLSRLVPVEMLVHSQSDL